MLSAPTRMAPAASSRSINAASRAAGGLSRLILEPASVGRPATSNRFLTANGTPASGPAGSPRARRIDRLRAQQRSLFGNGGKGVEQRVDFADARERRFDNTLRAGAAGSDRGRD